MFIHPIQHINHLKTNVIQQSEIYICIFSIVRVRRKRGDEMKVNIDINEKYDETTVTIHAKKWSKELEELIRKLEYQTPKRIIGVQGGKSVLLSPSEIDFIFAENRKVYASMNQKSIELTMKLYEAEELLESHGFCRLSKSALGNLNNMVSFELAFNGNLCVYFHSGSKEYVSRKYVHELKRKLILGVEEYDR
ncbi:LytTR family DNA-binding domain-containing protein [Niallia sp. Krafla_26]|uniref:LytTR family DNA-binding domain-containing protein n=1 Tax=Niallia sp. Krafla_26 TaxID=3064703 RepID=UPI003D1665EE